MIVLSFLVTFSYADSFSSIQYHFSFTVPMGWKEIPKMKIDERMRQLSNATGSKFINYIAGFQESEIQDFGYPNMLLQYHDLQGYKMTWDDFIKNFGNANLSSGINDSGYKSFIDNFNSTSPLIDSTKKIIIYNSEATVTGVGVLRSVVFLHLGKNGIVQINITIPKNNYNKYSSDIITIVDTLKFDYGYIYIGGVLDLPNDKDQNTQYDLASSNSVFDGAIDRGEKGLYSGIGFSFIMIIIFGAIGFVKKIFRKNDNSKEQ